MNRYAIGLAATLAIVLLLAGSIWTPRIAESQKSEAVKTAGCSKKCAQAEGCQKGQMTASGSCMGAGKGEQTMGCHSGMAQMPGRQMMTRHMMKGGERAGSRGKGHAKAGELHCLGGPALFAHKAEQLGLSEKQVEDLKAIDRDHQKSSIEKRAEIQIAHVELEELIDQKTVDFGKIKAKISQIADMEKQHRLARLSSVEKSHKLLTAEQLEKARTLDKKSQRGMKKGPRQVVKEIIIEETTE